MYKFVATEIIARGKEAEDKTWRKKQTKRTKELGFPPIKVYAAVGREAGRVFIEMGETETWQEAEEWGRAFAEDEELQKLEHERAQAGMVVEGSHENFILTDY